MRAWLDLMRTCAYVALGGILLTVLVLSAVPLATPPVWVATLSFICLSAAVGLIGLVVVGISRLTRQFRNAPSSRLDH
jgi:hypothetical protein